MKIIFNIIILGIIFFGVNPLLSFGQVTIGSNMEPNKGALLDMKEKPTTSGEANSMRGMILPRVKLTNKNNLYPMFETTAGSGIADSRYTGGLKSEEDMKHIGLVVYNLNKCNGFGQGTYVWIGNNWRPLPDVGDSIAAPGIFIPDRNAVKIDANTILYQIPSGKDLRTFPSDNNFGLNFQWFYPANGELKIISSGPEVGGGLKFFNSTNPSSWTTPVTVSPVTYNYQIEDMSDLITNNNPYVSNPFRSRETSVTFQVPANECYPSSREVKVRLNQTNYRVTVKRANGTVSKWSYRFMTGGRYGTGTNYYRLLITPVNTNEEYGDAISLELQSNAKWNFDFTPTNYYSDVFTDIDVPSKGGKEIIDGTMPETFYYLPKRNSQAQNYGTRGEVVATLNFEDTAVYSRYFPVMVDYLQCSVDLYDENGITFVGKQAGPWPKGSGVLKHTDQSNRFFYSAEFENAGRWMITNLAATDFDSGSNATKPLIPYDNTEADNHDNGNPKYAYPQTEASYTSSNNWGDEPSDWRQTEGLFYNWYAASGRAAVDNGNVEEGNTDQDDDVQGICPDGWHLPSDKEWSQLEAAVHTNMSTYSTYDQLILDQYSSQFTSWNSGWNTGTGKRGAWITNATFLAHGGAMKEICGVKGMSFNWMVGTQNYSKTPRLGGFNAMLTGRIKTYSFDSPDPSKELMRQEDRSGNGDYWSLSQKASTAIGGVSNTAWTRGFDSEGPLVNREDVAKTQLMSVRCKMND